MAYKQEVNVPLVVTIGIVGGILVLVCVIGVQAWFQSEEQNEVAVKAVEAEQRPDNWLKVLQDSQKTAIGMATTTQPSSTDVHWADKTKGTVVIPVAQAMDYLSKNAGRLP
jgi:hypothetical protein